MHLFRLALLFAVLVAGTAHADPPAWASPAHPTPSATRQPRHMSTLTRVGLGILGASYAAAVVGGVSVMSWNRYEQSQTRDAYDSAYYTAGGLLFIPVAGPIASAAYLRWNESWAYTWGIVDAPLQLAGLGVLLAGLFQDARDAGARSVEQPRAGGVTLTPLLSPTSVGLSGTF